MITMTLAELASILGAHTDEPNCRFSDVSKDTRTLQQGALYVAIVGENLDGHDYIEEAQHKGAVAALVSRKVSVPIPQIVVPDTVKALGLLAVNWRQRFDLPLVGVTGSNGKTTLKNMIATILKSACDDNAEQVLATKGNLNNFIGVPLTLFGLNDKHRYGVVEMGMNLPGEIRYLTNLTKPKIAVVNNAAESHLEKLNDVAGVAREKGQIFEGLPEDGVAILNLDDEHYQYWKSTLTNKQHLSFGLAPNADITATNLVENITEQHFTLHTPKGDVAIRLPLVGKHNAQNALAAAACAVALDLDLNAIKNGLGKMKPEKGRMNYYMLANGLCVIDDTYNANPFSTHAAITTLSNMPGKKILVLADMKELGTSTTSLHAITGMRAKEAGIDYLFTLGELTKTTAENFGSNAKHFTDQETLVAALQPFLSKGHTILVKGSRSMKMENIITKIMGTEHASH